MFQEFSSPLWITVVALSAIPLVISSCVLLPFVPRTLKEPYGKKGRIIMLSVSLAAIVGTLTLLGSVVGTMALSGHVKGEVYSNPNDVVKPSYWQHAVRGSAIRTDVDQLEEVLMKHTGADKLILPNKRELRFDSLQDGALKTFTGVDYGDNGEDAFTISGTFYYTDDAMVIITDVDSEHQETVTIPTS